jgi:hypothetical protein
MSVGKTYRATLENIIKASKSLYTEEEYEKLKNKNEKIDPVLEIQAWTMEVASTDPVPQYNILPRSYSSFIYSSLVKPSLQVPSKSIHIFYHRTDRMFGHHNARDHERV